ncbi:XRE family transcriptional regulator [Agreia sp. Leaf283]|uniref:helix-turn-helix domain-containing protein n=1 Tax=Agreia sp. Leaf283 TaxID=1736321 RepID=UPI0007013D78|nr:XRE family transcriptional regulator [Agreia sp. Leaf283]KQP53889.1 LacI family transcriptional regulator [Agreia sp. Leaf283]
MPHDLNEALARTVHSARVEQGMSITALAELSGVSRTMINRIERSEVQPTAALLARLSAGLGLTLSQLIVRAEDPGSRLRRAEDQQVWTDPDTGYVRRALSPAMAASLELVDVTLPPGATVHYPADAFRFIDQQIWVIDGTLDFTEGDALHRLYAGDCLQLGEPAECVFANAGPRDCRYLVALSKTSRAKT